MNDERYTFVQDVREKKRTARGYYNKGRQGGKIKMPSDYMTRKERNALNGEVNCYKLDRPMKWDEYKTMPEDLKKEYLFKLKDEYGASGRAIMDMLGINKPTFFAEQKKYNLWFPTGRWESDRKKKWEEFIGEAGEDAADNIVHAVYQLPEKKQETNNIAMLLSMLAGTGAKLTIEVTL